MKILTKADKPEVTNISQFGIWVVASGSELDADIELEAFKNPEKYPLQYRV